MSAFDEESIRQDIQDIVERLVAALSPIRIYLFGSYAQNTYTDHSDYDFYILCPDDAGDAIALSQRGYRALRGKRKKPVDIVIGFDSKFKERSMLPTIEKEVLKEGVLLYAK